MTQHVAPSPVYIVLLNYQGADDTLACLASLESYLVYRPYHVIVVDNASPDDSVARLKQAQEKIDFELIVSPDNRGFSAGNNLAIQTVLDRVKQGTISENAFIWLLNNDTTVHEQALTPLVKLAHQTQGLVGSLLLYPDQRYQQVGTQINWWTGSTRGYPDTGLTDGMQVTCLTGASMLIPISVFQKIGLLDESYFLYFEDAEFCLRAAHAGINCHVSLESKVYHHEGKTTGKHSLATQYYFHRNRMKVLTQYASPVQKACITLYQRFRLWRNGVKASLKQTTDRHRSMTVQQWAFHDYTTGVFGPCPHNLKQLEVT